MEGGLSIAKMSSVSATILIGIFKTGGSTNKLIEITTKQWIKSNSKKEYRFMKHTMPMQSVVNEITGSKNMGPSLFSFLSIYCNVFSLDSIVLMTLLSYVEYY